jgi:putative ABC transport system substrate-binding protein
MKIIGAGFASLLAALAAMGATDLPTQAEPAFKRVPRVAVIFNGTNEANEPSLDAFLNGLHGLGYTNGHSVALDVRWMDSRLDRLPGAIAGLLHRKPDVLVVAGSQAVRAARAATSTIPIVMAAVGDPVGQRLVQSLSHPGGNVTGIAIPAELLMAKVLEQLHELVPAASRIGVLVNPSNPVHAIAWGQTEALAKNRGVRLLRFEASSVAELERALAAIAAEHPQALVVSADALFAGFRSRIVRFAASNKIPAGYFSRDAVREGGLLACAPSIAENYFASARYVHQILMGAKPHDLPIAQPAQFELFINVRTARSLGITVPEPVVASAEELID